jgi:DNA primase
MVSMPLDWNELSTKPERWTLTTVPKRLRRVKVDPLGRVLERQATAL